MRTEADAPPCTVVVVPTHGFGNRMRMLSCAQVYAAHHGCALQALWRTTLHMPTPWADLFATPLAQPDPSTVVRYGDRLYTMASVAASFALLSADDPDACEPGPPAGHTDQWIDSVDPRVDPKAVLFIGGHLFRPPSSLDAAELRRRRALFYRSLLPVPTVAARVPDTRGHTCVHYRALGGIVDNANGQV